MDLCRIECDLPDVDAFQVPSEVAGRAPTDATFRIAARHAVPAEAAHAGVSRTAGNAVVARSHGFPERGRGQREEAL